MSKEKMEEKGMEKLRFLLNEFEPYICKDGEHRDNLWYGVICGESAIFTKEIGVQKIISKEYKFIQWLVKENKIDLYKVRHHFCIELYAIDYGDGDYMCQDYEVAIAVLAIQKDPIDFLLSVLK